MTSRRVCAVALAILVVAGCSGSASSPTVSGPGPSSAPTAAPGSGAAGSPTPAASAAADGSIPPGREISEGGGGPKQYTFREIWRRALALVQASWRPQAYLLTATGNQVNDEGVPDYWSLLFADPAADAVLLLDIDGYARETERHEVTGEGLSSFLGTGARKVPYAVIDSDQAAAVGKADLTLRYNLAKTKDPRLALGYSAKDESGPWWTYSLFFTSTAEYVVSTIDALTGTVNPAG